MWIKRTENEMIQVRLQQNRRRIWGAIGFGVIPILAAISRGKHPSDNLTWFDPANVILGRLVFAVPFSLILGLFAYWQNFAQKRQFMICPHCDAVYAANSASICTCGSPLEKMETMKWNEDV